MLLQNCSYVCIPHTVLDIQQKDIDTFRITVNAEADFNKSSGDNVALLDSEFDMKVRIFHRIHTRAKYLIQRL